MAFRASTRTGTPADALVMGLANPGAEYAGTRHNVGADVVNVLARRHGAALRVSAKERASVAEIRLGNKRVVLAIPTTYMNLSGESAGPLVKRHGIADVGSLIVIHDELDLPTARLKLKVGGGVAGHNGLKSVRAHVGSAEFVRVRVGIGRPPGTQNPADYVLRRPGASERKELEVTVELAADAVEEIISDGVDRAMNRVNTL